MVTPEYRCSASLSLHAFMGALVAQGEPLHSSVRRASVADSRHLYVQKPRAKILIFQLAGERVQWNTMSI